MNVIKEGSRIIISKSLELSECRLNALVGRVGMVVADLNGPERKVKGYIVRLAEGPYLDELEWFIPVESIKEYVAPTQRNSQVA